MNKIRLALTCTILIGAILIETFVVLSIMGYSKYNPLSMIETYNYKTYQMEHGYEWDDVRRLDDGRYQHKTCSLTNFPMVIQWIKKPTNYISTHYSKEICLKRGGVWEWEYMIPVITL
jgi:hypothetical protein